MWNYLNALRLPTDTASSGLEGSAREPVAIPAALVLGVGNSLQPKESHHGIQPWVFLMPILQRQLDKDKTRYQSFPERCDYGNN